MCEGHGGTRKAKEFMRHVADRCSSLASALIRASTIYTENRAGLVRLRDLGDPSGLAQSAKKALPHPCWRSRMGLSVYGDSAGLESSTRTSFAFSR